MGTIKIAISGAHSTGKTTYLNKLTELLNSTEIKYKTVGDLAITCPLPILKKHTIESTLWIAARGILEEIEAENDAAVVLVDRPILDCWAYFNFVCKGRYSDNNPKLKTLIGMIENWLPTYDLILQTVINNDIPIEDDKGRDLNPAYRKQIGDEMVRGAKRFRIEPKYLEYENREEKVQSVFNFIRKQPSISN